MHTYRLPSAFQQFRTVLGLSLPRLDLRYRWPALECSRHHAARHSQIGTDETQGGLMRERSGCREASASAILDWRRSQTWTSGNTWKSSMPPAIISAPSTRSKVSASSSPGKTAATDSITTLRRATLRVSTATRSSSRKRGPRCLDDGGDGAPAL